MKQKLNKFLSRDNRLFLRRLYPQSPRNISATDPQINKEELKIYNPYYNRDKTVITKGIFFIDRYRIQATKPEFLKEKGKKNSEQKITSAMEKRPIGKEKSK